MVELLRGVIRDYEWGSTSSIPDLLGVAADGRPWAELWFGAHPSGPALVGADQHPLDELIAADPAAALGAAVTGRFGGLPFLVKFLAAASPLSLQTHPSREQAEAGYAREDAAGIAIDAPERSFRDRNHKPELICALTPFEALCGFRDPLQTLDLLATLDTVALDAVRERLETGTDLVGVLEYLLTLPAEAAAVLVEQVVAACHRAGPGEWQHERDMVAALGAAHPDDAGVVTALLLNRVELQPGEALFLGAGKLHMYLHGTGIEVMANSDNVLRGGLTSKHVDVATLLDIVDARPGAPEVQHPEAVDGVSTYHSPTPEFSVSRFDVTGRSPAGSGPAILACTEGVVTAGSRVLDRGAVVFMSASEPPMLLEGRGTVFRVGVGLH